MERYNESLQNSSVISFVLEFKGLIEMVYGYIFLYYNYYGSTGANRVEHGEK